MACRKRNLLEQVVVLFTVVVYIDERPKVDSEHETATEAFDRWLELHSQAAGTSDPSNRPNPSVNYVAIYRNGHSVTLDTVSKLMLKEAMRIAGRLRAVEEVP